MSGPIDDDMLFWIAIAVLTVAAAYAMLMPLFRSEAGETREEEASVAVFADQLAEIDREQERGVLPADEAEAARREISRRLLRASKRDTRLDRAPWRRRAAALAVAALVPVVGFGVYAAIGNPDSPDLPLVVRQSETERPMSIDGMVEMVEARLEEVPDDGVGWGVIAPIYLSQGRYEDAAAAYEKAMEFDGETASRFTGLGEALTLAAGGTVTVRATAAFERALALDSAAVKPRVFLAIAARQRGDFEEARQRWSLLLADATGDEPWAPLARREFAAMGAGDPFPAPESRPEPAAAAGAGASTDAMIAGMVNRLASRLAENGGTAEEWVQLIRSHLVLGDVTAANAAFSDGLADLEGDPAAIDALRAGAASLGLGAAAGGARDAGASGGDGGGEPVSVGQ